MALSDNKVRELQKLRRRGQSLSEIVSILGIGKTTAYRYAKNITILPKYREAWKEKRNWSKKVAEQNWVEAKDTAEKLLGSITTKMKLLATAALYWGEGNKKELNLINSDPFLIKTFLNGLSEMGVAQSDICCSIRIYEDLDVHKSKKFWAHVVGVRIDSIGLDVLRGKKFGKLPYGMCRIRVRKGAHFFKLIMSMIDVLQFNTGKAAVVQWIERGTPKP